MAQPPAVLRDKPTWGPSGSQGWGLCLLRVLVEYYEVRGAEELAESHIDMILSVRNCEWFLVVLVDPFLDMQSPNGRTEMAGTWEKGAPSPWKAILQPCLLPSASQLLYWKIGGPGYNPEDS